MRLVKIENQTNHSDTPKCSIQIVDLDQKPVFKALSYAWGSTPNYPIDIDGLSLYITKNLSDFLQTVQTDSHFCRTPFFIDQLCIDQSSSRERNQQVSQMGEIYASAQQTIAWLGLTDEPFEGTNVIWESSRSLHEEEAEALCSVPYWSRLWIIQELILSKCRFILFKQQIFLAQYLLPYLRKLKSTYIGARILWELNRKQKQGFCWQEVAMLFPGAQCKIPHDKVYGMLGIVHPDLRVQPDYRKSLREVFEEVMEAERVHRGYSELQCKLIRRQLQKYLSLPEDVV